MSHAIKETFRAILTTSVTVHLDGKLLRDMASKCSVNRLSITASGYDVNQFLAVHKLPKCTGISTVNAVYAASED